MGDLIADAGSVRHDVCIHKFKDVEDGKDVEGAADVCSVKDSAGGCWGWGRRAGNPSHESKMAKMSKMATLSVGRGRDLRGLDWE